MSAAPGRTDPMAAAVDEGLFVCVSCPAVSTDALTLASSGYGLNDPAPLGHDNPIEEAVDVAHESEVLASAKLLCEFVAAVRAALFPCRDHIPFLLQAVGKDKGVGNLRLGAHRVTAAIGGYSARQRLLKLFRH